jgi:glyoxylase-like metal-dependent hydrolase (beta-lactamase superfamily II)
VGGLSALRARIDAPVWMHHETARLLGPETRADRFLEDGDSIELEAGAHEPPRRVRVLHTPGHAPGHLCFLDEASRACIVGDMVASVGTILIDPHDGDMLQYLQSLRRLASLAPGLLLPAHGGPIDEPVRVLEYYVAHRLQREARIVAALEVQEGPAPLQTLLPIAYDDTPRALYPLAARALESHLRKLQDEGRVHRDAQGLYVLADG